MPFYKGKTRDGSDIEEIDGVAYVNPRNPNEWSNQPYPEQRKLINMKARLLKYMAGKYTLDDVFKQIQDKTCGLSRSLRDYVSSHYDAGGNFIHD